MELSYNISFSIAAFAINVVLMLIVSINYSSTNLVNKRFKIFLWSTIAMFILDIATVITNDYSSYMPVPLNIILNGLYFFSGACVAIFFLYYCVSIALRDKTKTFRRNFYMINLIILFVYFISLIVNGFTGIYFYFDKSLKYSHGPVYLLVNLLSVGFTIEALIIFLIERKKFNFKQLIAIPLFMGAFFISFILQLFVFPDILLSDFGIALASLILFFSIETPDYVKLMVTLNELNELKSSLEMQVQNRTNELNLEKESYEELTLETLSSLAMVIDAKDHYTIGHSFRVAAYARGMAQELGFSLKEQEEIYFAGLIHDVGKIGISEIILTKPGKLNFDEFETIKSHSALGGDILKGIKEFPVFEKVARSHHERYDGNGYPDKLAGDNIPFEARIVTICDTFDAMTSDRSYRKALSDEVALAEFEKYKGTQFDPQLVEIFKRLYNKFPDSIKNHIDELSISESTIFNKKSN